MIQWISWNSTNNFSSNSTVCYGKGSDLPDFCRKNCVFSIATCYVNIKDGIESDWIIKKGMLNDNHQNWICWFCCACLNTGSIQTSSNIQKLGIQSNFTIFSFQKQLGITLIYSSVSIVQFINGTQRYTTSIKGESSMLGDELWIGSKHSERAKIPRWAPWGPHKIDDDGAYNIL